MQTDNFDFSKLDSVPNGAMKDITANSISEDITANTTSVNESIVNESSNGHLADFGKYNAQQQQQFNQPGQQLKAGNLITGEVAVNLADMIIPTILVMVIKKGMDKTVSKRSFALTTTEKDTIKPVLQNYLNSINFTVENPLNALLLTMGMIYVMKVIEVVNEVPTGKFTPGTPGAADVGQPTAAGTIKKDGRGRPKGTTKIK